MIPTFLCLFFAGTEIQASSLLRSGSPLPDPSPLSRDKIRSTPAERSLPASRPLTEIPQQALGGQVSVQKPGEPLNEDSPPFMGPVTGPGQDADSPDAPMPEPFGRKHPPRLSLEGAERPEVIALMEDYLAGNRISWFSRVYQQSFLFRSHIMSMIQKYHLPPEIFFIPYIESEYTVSARSTSNALGMWQFMENSMSPWLTRNSYKDERLSFFAATEAGILKLMDNYRVLGDWLLAAAAYNAGLGALSRALQLAGPGADYWTLVEKKLIPEQTMRYVPKLLAAAAAVAQLGRRGQPPSWDMGIEWTQVMVPAGTGLAEIAKASGYSVEILSLTNRNLLDASTPPNERFYPVTVPQDAADRILRSILSGFQN